MPNPPGFRVSPLGRLVALTVLLAVLVMSIQSGRLAAQQPPENNPATGTPTLIGPLRVGEVVRVDTSSIADPDGLTDTSFSFTWQADDDLLEPGAFFRALGLINGYPIAPYDAGLTIVVQVHFDDDEGNSESFDVQATSTVAAVAPDSPANLSASLGNSGELDLSWSTPAVCDFTLVFDCWLDLDRTFSVGDGGSEITGYTVQWKLASGSWGVASNVSEAEVTATSHTVTGLTAGNTYTVRVLARNAVDAGAPSTEVTVSGTDLNVGPVVSGRAMPRFFETNPRTVETYTATDPENDTITWMLSGPDGSFFSITNGVLNFDSAGDYENPRDVDRNNAYEVTIHASDGSNGAVFPVTVVIYDSDEVPVVTGPTPVNVRGGSSCSVGRYRASDPEGFVTSWETLSGIDAQHFDFSDTGDLSFTAVPAFDTPADADADNTYEITVSASSDGDRGIRTGTLDVTVTVTDPNQRISPPISTGGGGGGGPTGPTPSDADFEWNVTRDVESLDAANDEATGLWGKGATLWVLQNSDGAGDSVYAYDLASGERAEDREFALDESNRAPRGIWSDGATVWVSDSGQDSLFAHDLASGDRLPDRDLALSEENDDARGIWSDRETMWVLDGRDDSIYLYDLASGAQGAVFELDSANDDPHGIWSDHTGVWVSNGRPGKLLAYRLRGAELERVSGEDFTNLRRASNNSPRGIWSDGEVMYVVDAHDGKVYSYNMPDAADARLASLTLSHIDIGEFSPRRTEYTGILSGGAGKTVIEASAVQSGAMVEIVPSDVDGDLENGHQAGVDAGTEVTVTVTSEDGSRRRVYRVLIEVPECLDGLGDEFGLVTYEGGSIASLEACARRLSVQAVYAWDGSAYLSYILNAPAFVNEAFVVLFEGGISHGTQLLARREPASDLGAEDGDSE